MSLTYPGLSDEKDLIALNSDLNGVTKKTDVVQDYQPYAKSPLELLNLSHQKALLTCRTVLLRQDSAANI